MKENELIFDRTKHVCYSEAVKQVITDCLKKQFSKKEADILWEKIQLKYTEYLQTLPYLGGAKDNHNASRRNLRLHRFICILRSVRP